MAEHSNFYVGVDMAPIRIEKVSKLESLDILGISDYLRDLLYRVPPEGVIFCASDIKAIVNSIEALRKEIELKRKRDDRDGS